MSWDSGVRRELFVRTFRRKRTAIRLESHPGPPETARAGRIDGNRGTDVPVASRIIDPEHQKRNSNGTFEREQSCK